MFSLFKVLSRFRELFELGGSPLAEISNMALSSTDSSVKDGIDVSVGHRLLQKDKKMKLKVLLRWKNRRANFVLNETSFQSEPSRDFRFLNILSRSGDICLLKICKSG